MTVIAGLVTDDGVILGADRMMSSCFHKSDSGPKVFAREGWAFAVTGNPRAIQIMERVSREYRIESREDVVALAEALYADMKEKGLGSAPKGQMPDFDAAFLIATPRGLFALDSNFGVYEQSPFGAHGIGMEYALGVLHDASQFEADPVDLVRRAVRAANALNPHCGGGPDIVRVALRETTDKAPVILAEAGDGSRE